MSGHKHKIYHRRRNSNNFISFQNIPKYKAKQTVPINHQIWDLSPNGPSYFYFFSFLMTSTYYVLPIYFGCQSCQLSLVTWWACFAERKELNISMNRITFVSL